MVIPVFIPHKGCPFDCIYCNQKAISGQTEEMTVEKMYDTIDSHLSTAQGDSFIEIGFYGGSFTGIEDTKQIMFLEAANEYVAQGRIKGIRLSTRPDYINSQILNRLKMYNVKTVELGVQSLDEDVLKTSGRGHGTDDVYKACCLIKENGIGLGIQTMIGLPGSNYEKDLDTARKVVELSPQIVRIYPTLVVRNTYLEKMFNEGSYTPLELEEAVSLCAKLLELYNKNDIKVIRIGLQPTDNINNNFDVVGGPFHPAFRQLVESRLWRDRIENYIKEYSLFKEHDIIIYTDKKYICDIIGQRRGNIEYLKSKYQFKRISIKSIEDLKDEFFIRGL
ncbi:Radical SAM domain protein [Pseudobacteroides cellulosolvens ATCC 35603 = DSM 2933]|uniref:Radical SAM domain protein n=2 Tax=Pseudobacteroides cellulosolvens TaxID=35825 RepID=A0A0L6JJZ5_9FIRM|nr:Radical SAM domain protein [Pseudobacteroides cellulosolvens ATCC 35603 = DSM 2933]